jgi:hypothetical protein
MKTSRTAWVALQVALLCSLCERAAGDEYRYPVSESMVWGFIDGEGRIAIPPTFFKAGHFSEGLAAVAINEGCAYSDINGLLKPRLPLTVCNPFHSGRARFGVEATGRSGFLAPDGSVAIPARFDAAHDFSEGIAAVREASRWEYIDTNGRRLAETTYADARPFSEGLAGAAPKDLFGFIDRFGTMVIEPRFRDVGTFHEGLASVRTDSGGGYIDKRGTFVGPQRWAFAGRYSEGLAAVSVDGKHGFIRTDGSLAIRPQFVDSTDFSGGIAAVQISNRTDRPTWVYIGKRGEPRVPQKFWSAEPFIGPLAAVQLERDLLGAELSIEPTSIDLEGSWRRSRDTTFRRHRSGHRSAGPPQPKSVYFPVRRALPVAIAIESADHCAGASIGRGAEVFRGNRFLCRNMPCHDRASCARVNPYSQIGRPSVGFSGELFEAETGFPFKTPRQLTAVESSEAGPQPDQRVLDFRSRSSTVTRSVPR